MVRGIEHMNELVLTRLKAVLNSYARSNAPDALSVWQADKEVDALCNSVSRELLTYMMEDPRNISPCIHLLFCAKNIERMGDHATNIAEAVRYIACGEVMLEDRPKVDTTRIMHIV